MDIRKLLKEERDHPMRLVSSKVVTDQALYACTSSTKFLKFRYLEVFKCASNHNYLKKYLRYWRYCICLATCKELGWWHKSNWRNFCSRGVQESGAEIRCGQPQGHNWLADIQLLRSCQWLRVFNTINWFVLWHIACILKVRNYPFLSLGYATNKNKAHDIF